MKCLPTPPAIHMHSRRLVPTVLQTPSVHSAKHPRLFTLFGMIALSLNFGMRTPQLLADGIDAQATSEASIDGLLTFEKQIRPIFKAHCFHCHGEGDKLKGNLDVRLRRLIVQGGDSGPGLVPEHPQESLLFERIEAGEMPPGDKKLTAAQVALIGRWIASGAKTAAPEPEQIGDELPLTDEERSFWAFQPVRRPAPPAVKGQERVRNPIDAFLLARLEAQQLGFSPDADRPTLLRRAYFDLLGLPPSPADAALFLADDAPGAWERLIDRLLASPHYGERWGRHWLDVAGYADSDGYTPEDTVRRYAYKYRDYVIRAFNADKPFDEFIREQLAGDEQVSGDYRNLTAESIEKLVATGFLCMGPDGTASGVDQNVARNQVMAETIKIVSTSLLGLSVGCAECHNHRYDPIPQTDYYRMRAIFEPAYDWKNWRSPPQRLISLYTDADRQAAAQVEAEAVQLEAQRTKKQDEYILKTFNAQLEKAPEASRELLRVAFTTPVAQRTPEQVQLLKDNPMLNVTAGSLYLYDKAAADDLKKDAEQIAAVRAKKPVEEFIRVLNEVPGQVPATFVFNRGDFAQPKQQVEPGALSVLALANPSEIPVNSPALPTTGRRTAFARALTSGEHPLLGRVLVNRFWMHHFGRGIVGTPGDFGFLGERPSHPELLDWLAADFVAGGWRLKRLHRLILTSTAYRQSAQRSTELDTVDPDNRLLGRMSIRRMEAETVRDAILTVSGRLNPKLFGPPVPIMEDEVGQIVVGIENKNGENRPGPVLPMFGEEFRRSLYVQVRRTRPLALLDVFDAPIMEPNCELRTASTVTPQSLMLMNSGFVVTHSEQFAERVRSEAGTDDLAAQVNLAWRIAFCSDPSPADLEQSLAYLAAQTEAFRSSAPGTVAAAGSDASTVPSATGTDPSFQALATFCQSLISANPFLYVE